jgi:hypothetical protein
VDTSLGVHVAVHLRGHQHTLCIIRICIPYMQSFLLEPKGDDNLRSRSAQCGETGEMNRRVHQRTCGSFVLSGRIVLNRLRTPLTETVGGRPCLVAAESGLAEVVRMYISCSGNDVAQLEMEVVSCDWLTAAMEVSRSFSNYKRNV